MPLVGETLLLAPWEIVTRTTLKCIGVSPTVANLAEATNARVVAGAAGGVCPAAGTASAAQIRKLPIIVDRIGLSLNELVRVLPAVSVNLIVQFNRVPCPCLQ